MPIYYVILEIDRGHPLSTMYPIWNIIRVFECDLSEIDDIWDREVKPILETGRNFNTMIIHREPPNPFRKVE